MLTGHNFTGMAQRQRAGLITPRSLDRNGLPVFIIRSFQNCQAVTTATFHRRGAEVARAAHNRKDIRSKRIVGIFQFAVYRTAMLSPQHPFHRCGAEGARGAHNSEVRCSNHLAGIIPIRSFQNCHAVYTANTRLAGVAQRKSA